MLYRRRLKFFLLKVLRLHGTPHKVALGFAIGSAINFIPTFGFAIPLAAFTAGVLGLNIISAIIGDILFKPLFPIFLYFNLRVGYLFFGHNLIENKRHITALLHFRPHSLKVLGSSYFFGMSLNIIIFVICMYAITFAILKYYRIPLLRSLRDSKMLN